MSLLRPCDAVENLCFLAGEVDSDIWALEPFFVEGKFFFSFFLFSCFSCFSFFCFSVFFFWFKVSFSLEHL